MGLWDGLLDEDTTTARVDTSPLPSHDGLDSLLPKLLMAGGLMGSSLSGNDQTAKILPLFLRQQAAEALQARKDAERKGSVDDYGKIEGALTEAYQKAGDDSTKASLFFSEALRGIQFTDPNARKVAIAAGEKLREKGRADSQEFRYQGLEQKLNATIPENGVIAPYVYFSRGQALGLPNERIAKQWAAIKENMTRNNQAGIEQVSAVGSNNQLGTQYTGNSVNMPTEKLGGSVVSRDATGMPSVAPLQGSSPVLVPKPGEGIGMLNQGAEGGPTLTPGISTPQKVENTPAIINAAAFHKVDLRQLEEDMNSDDPRTQARAKADRQILATHALAEKTFTPEVMRIAAQTPGLLKKLYDRVANDLIGQTSAAGNPAGDVSRGILGEKAATAGAIQTAENPAKIDLYNQTTKLNQQEGRAEAAATKGGEAYKGSHTFISRETFLAPDSTPTEAEANSPEFRQQYARLGQAKALMVDRANRAMNTVDAVLRQAEEMDTNLVKGARTKVKEWLGTGPGKSYQTLVLDTVAEVGPALTGSVRTLGKQFEENLKNAPNLKDQVDVTRVYATQLKAILDNARRSAMGMSDVKIPTYNEVMQMYPLTTPGGFKMRR